MKVMAEEISDDRFKEEMLRLMRSVALKVGENAKEIALLRKDFDKNTRELKCLKKEIRVNAGSDYYVQFGVLEMFNRLYEIENQVNSLTDQLPDLKKGTSANLLGIIKIG